MTHYALMPGTLAYLDTFSGLIPCKVTACHAPDSVTVRVTANRRGYTAGEIIRIESGQHLPYPRTAVFTRGGTLRIADYPRTAYPAPAQEYTA